MKITQITVSYGATQSLPSYSNVKPQLTLTATIDDGEDPIEAEAQLWDMVKHAVHQQIDLALEANDQAAKYDPRPRFQVLQTYWNQWDHRGEEKPPQYVVILPNEITLNRDAYGQCLISAAHTGDSRKLRYSHALAIAQSITGDTEEPRTLFDCADGDLTPLNLALSAPERTAPGETQDVASQLKAIYYSEQGRTEEEREEEEAENEEEPRDFVAERMLRTEIKNSVSDDGPDNSM